MSQSPRSLQLPPRVPPDAEDISRAICLLGNRIASDLKEKTKSELISLIGTYPSQEQAKYWKQALKQMLKEANEPEPEPKAVPALLASSQSPHKKQFSNKPQQSRKRSTRQSTQSTPRSTSKSDSKSVRQRKRELAKKGLAKKELVSNEYLHSGVSNLAGIDLDLLREEEDWETDFGF